MSLRVSVRVACAVGSVLCLVGLVSAGPLLNGDFSDGLNGWDTYGEVHDGGGFALLGEDPSPSWLMLASLEQEFVMPIGITALSFWHQLTGTEGWIPDGFQASLLDPVTFDPIISADPLDPFVTYFYSAGNDGSIHYDPTMVRVSDGTVRADLTSVMASIGGTSVLLAFDLSSWDYPLDTEVHIDDVQLIPEPVTAVLFGIGALGLRAYRRRRRA